MGTDRRGTAVVMAALALAMVAPARALAHDHGGLAETEQALLGAEHAQEHAVQREALRRWLELPAAERRRQARVARRSAAAAEAEIAAEPFDQVGRWEPQLIGLPTYAINTVLLPTGEVLFWGRAPIGTDGTRLNETKVFIWDPRGGAPPQEIPAPRADLDGDGDLEHVPLFCSGQSLLPSGEVLLAGGTLEYADPPAKPNFSGLRTVYTLDPWTRAWTEQPRMEKGRWYPTQVELADGRSVIVAGMDEAGHGALNPQLEVFTPGARGGVGTLASSVAGDLLLDGWNRIDTYPHMFVLPGGSVLLAGHDQRADEARAAVLDPARLGDPVQGSAWTQLDPLPWFAQASQAALILGERGSTPYVTVLGGYEKRDVNPVTAVNWVDSIAAGQRSWSASPVPARTSGARTATSSSSRTASWSRSAAARASVPLRARTTPAATSGSSRSSCCGPASTPPGGSVRRSRSGARTTRPRCCCLTAACCRPATTTGTSASTPTRRTPMDVGEIYSPPYLFDGDRLLAAAADDHVAARRCHRYGAPGRRVQPAGDGGGPRRARGDDARRRHEPAARRARGSQLAARRP